jgi:hypothetical protein
MQFNNIFFFEKIGDAKLYSSPALNVGDIIDIKFNNTDVHIPGTRQLKAGKYEILKYRKALTSTGSVYDFKSIRKNAKYIFSINTIAIDKALESGFILKISAE